MRDCRDPCDDDPRSYAFLFSGAAQTVAGVTGTIGPSGPTGVVYDNFVFSNAVIGGNMKTVGASQIEGLILPYDGVYQANFVIDGISAAPGTSGVTLDALQHVVALYLTNNCSKTIVKGSITTNNDPIADLDSGNVIFRAKKGDQLQLVNDSIEPVELFEGVEDFVGNIANNVQLTVTLVKKY